MKGGGMTLVTPLISLLLAPPGICGVTLKFGMIGLAPIMNSSPCPCAMPAGLK